MKNLKKILISCFIFIITYFSIFSYSCAESKAVTKDNLNVAFQKFVSSDANSNNYKITVTDETITIIIDEKSYVLNYDLSDEPTFSLEVLINKGMTYEQYKNDTDNLILPMLGYFAVANIQGIEYEDSMGYFLFSYMENTLNGSFSNENVYIIVDDMNLEDGVTIEKDEYSTKTIYTSEFGDRVIEYVNSVYKDNQCIDDKNYINSYTWNTEKVDINDSSCKLISTLSVKMDANFSKLVGYADSIGNSFGNENTTADNILTENNVNNENKNNIDNTISKQILPKTGFNNIVYVLIICGIFVMVVFGIKLKEYKI